MSTNGITDLEGYIILNLQQKNIDLMLIIVQQHSFFIMEPNVSFQYTCISIQYKVQLKYDFKIVTSLVMKNCFKHLMFCNIFRTI